MLKRSLVSGLVLSLAILASPARAVDLGLVATLVSKLGVTQKQAEGGAGSILDYAKNNLSKDDFAKVASALPETESLLKAAPKSDSSSLGAIGGALSGGSTLGTVAGLASLTGTFQKLGLSSDMVGKFIPIVLDYAQGKGGNAVSGILASVLTPSSAPAATPAAAPVATPAAAKAPEPTPTAKVAEAPKATPTAAAKPTKSTTKKSTKAPTPTKPKS